MVSRLRYYCIESFMYLPIFVCVTKRWTWLYPRYKSRAVLDHVLAPASHMRFISRCFTPG